MAVNVCVLIPLFHVFLAGYQGPYGTFGKVDDFKVIGAKTESRGKREYR